MNLGRLGPWKILLPILFLLTSSTAIFGQRAVADTALADLAASLQPGESAFLDTAGIDSAFTATGSGASSNTHIIWSDEIVWNSVHRKLQFVGGDHYNGISGPDDGPHFIEYDEVSNSWTDHGIPPHIVPSTNHGYDHMAVDPETGYFYVRRVGVGPGNGPVIHYWDGSTWSPIAANNQSAQANEVAVGIDFFPELNGIIWAGIVPGDGLGGLYLWDKTSNSWSTLVTGIPGFPCSHHLAKYNPVHKIVLAGGGGGGCPQGESNLLHKVDAQANVSAIAPAPHPLSIQRSVLTSDPVSGDYLALFTDGSFWAYDALSNLWTQQSSAPPVFTTTSTRLDGILASRVDSYGVNLFVTCKKPAPCRVTIYRHTARPGGDIPPAAPTALTAE